MIFKIFAVLIALGGVWSYAQSFLGGQEATPENAAHIAGAISAAWISFGAALLLWWLAVVVDMLSDIREALRGGHRQADPERARKPSSASGNVPSGKQLMRMTGDDSDGQPYKL